MSRKPTKTAGQKDAEGIVEAFRKRLGPFVAAAEGTRMPMVFTDAKEPGNPIIFANDAFLSLTGYDREEVLGKCFNALISHGIDPDTMEKVEAAFAGTADTDPEIHYRRKDGSEFWASILVCPVRDAAGKIVQHFASFVDLTKHKQDQARCQMLINELNHRVKNTLSTVQSVVAQTLRTSTNPEAIRESIESRLLALARSHDLLTQAQWDGAGLHDLVDNALEAFGALEGIAERFVITGENLRLPPNAALTLAIAFHELATNAVKYGALSNEAGSILIDWTVKPAPGGKRLILCWREEGGPPVTPPTRKGFGSWVIERGLAHELEGTVDLDYRPDGVVCTIDIPLPRDARAR